MTKRTLLNRLVVLVIAIVDDACFVLINFGFRLKHLNCVPFRFEWFFTRNSIFLHNFADSSYDSNVVLPLGIVESGRILPQSCI